MPDPTFHATAADDLQSSLQAVLNSSSYLLPERDTAFLMRPELRPVRVQLELLKPELLLEEHRIASTIVLFGSTQVVAYDQAAGRLERAKIALEGAPDDVRLKRLVARAERRLAKSLY